VPAEIPDNYPLEKLEEMFREFVASVEDQIDAESDESKAESKAASAECAGHIMEPQPEQIDNAGQRRDALAAFIFALEAREARLRQAVKQAEALARRYKTRADFCKGGVFQYMVDRGIARIEGFIHRFAIHKQPDQLVITNESVIPERFFDERPTTERTLNKQRLLVALQRNHGYDPRGACCTCGEKIPDAEAFSTHWKESQIGGAYLETNRNRLDVK